MKRQERFTGDLADLIAVNSVEGEPKAGAPFGEDVKRAFDTFGEIAGRLGFTVLDHDGYLGEIRVDGDDPFGVIGHLDVVPAPFDGWDTDPFVLTEKDGTYYGRGVVDDKGPTLACLYALREALDELKEKGETPKRGVRFYVGLNEESGWKDVAYYKKSHTFPTYGFSPDGNFPVVYAEKGPCRVVVNLKKPKGYRNAFAGTAGNAVPDVATVETDAVNETLLQKYSLTYAGKTVISHGKAAHGSAPHLGVNALKPLLSYVSETRGNCYEKELAFLFEDSAGIQSVGNATGYATFSANLLRETEDVWQISCDVRVPAGYTANDLKEKFDATGVPYGFYEHRAPLYVDKDGAWVQTLSRAYSKTTGKSGEPVSCAGATFASVFPQGVAFGPEADGDYKIHEPNENVKKDELLLWVEIYKAAFLALLS